MERILVLYRTGKNDQKYCLYHGGVEEAEREWAIIEQHDPQATFVARLRITTHASIEEWNDG